MKKNYVILLLITTVIVSITNAQQTIYSDNFETGYTADSEIQSTDTSWLIAGTGFTFPAKNVASGGAASSNWYVRMERGGTGDFAYIERVYLLTAGETYEFKASIFPDASGQKGAYNLRVMDGTNVKAASAIPTTGSTWDELSVSYTAAETKNYKFRVHKNWGNQGASIDNYSIVCTTCASPTVTYDGTSWDYGSPIGTTDTSIDVIITSGNVVFSGTSSFKSLTINAGASATLTTGNSITTVDGTELNAGASLIAEGTSTVTGNVTYNRNLATTNWYLMSSPVVGETYDDAYVTANGIASGADSNRGIAPYETSDDTWDYMQAGESLTFTPGSGYSVNRSTAGDISFTGTLNTDNDGVDVVLTNTVNRFNLLGNPYPSHVASSTFLTNEAAVSETQTLWVWNQATGAYEVKTIADAIVIAPAQGFFIKANAAGGTFNFAESNQAGSGGTFQRTEARPEMLLKLSDQSDVREAKIYYIEDMTLGFDVGYEGELFNGVANPLAIYTHLVADSEGKNYQVQSLPENDFENTIIPLGINAISGSSISIEASKNNFPEGMNIYLEDTQDNSFTLLESGVNFNTTLENDLSGIGRFYLHTTSSTMSTNDLATNNNLSIYSYNKETLRVVGVQKGVAKISIYNLLGQEVLSSSFQGNGVNDISLPSVINGIYIVKITSENRTTNKKIIIN